MFRVQLRQFSGNDPNPKTRIARIKPGVRIYWPVIVGSLMRVVFVGVVFVVAANLFAGFQQGCALYVQHL